MFRNVDETVYVGRGTFDRDKVIEGQELSFDRSSPKQDKKQKIEDLKKQLKELESGT